MRILPLRKSMSPWLLCTALFVLASQGLHAQSGPRQTPVPAQQDQLLHSPQSTRQSLTLPEAEQIALQGHPRIQAVTNLAQAAKERVTVQRSAYYPFVNGSATGSYAENGTRIGAGELNSPRVFDRYGNGLAINQLVTDFGRTHDLVKSSEQNAEAQQENVATTRQGVLLEVDQSYYAVLKSQSLLAVAQETVKERQTASDQITLLGQNQLKSGLDVRFAEVQLSQAQLLLIQAQNNLQAAFAQLSATLGYGDVRTFQLVEQPVPPAPGADVSVFIDEAIKKRPELAGQRLNVQSAESYAKAERDLWFPTLTGEGVAGFVPIVASGGLAASTLPAPRYAAAGFNLNVPIFNGHQFGALRAEATYQARAQSEYLRDLQDSIVRDVTTAWLNAKSGFQELSITQQLLDEASQALELAQSRYQLGLSSIVELTQAQLNQTQAQIDQASAKYDYQTEVSILNYQLGAAP